jgi:hypothetical protein
LEGERVSPPPEWVVSRVCEEFNCLPSQAVRELMNDPSNLALDIMELRAYSRAKEALDNAEKPDDVPNHPMIDRVFEVQYELLKRRKEGENGRDS